MSDKPNPIAILDELDPEAIQARIDDLDRQQAALRILLRAARARRKNQAKQKAHGHTDNSGGQRSCCGPHSGRRAPMSKSDATRPARLEVIAENIPERLRKLRRWVVWRWHRRKGKWDKPPLQTNGAFASVDDSSTWCSFDDAKAAFQSGQFDGIGFVLGYVVDEDVTYVGVDLDNCRDPQTGEIQDWGAAHLAVLNTYAEVSPSGEGVKALAIGTLPGPDRNESARLGVEMYRGNRYFTVTGHRLTNTPVEIHERTAELAELYYQLFGETKKGSHTRRASSGPDDRELALAALTGLKTSLAIGYWDWLRVGMALYAVSDDAEMLRAWDNWSQHGSDKYQPDVCARKWKSFGKKSGLDVHFVNLSPVADFPGRGLSFVAS